MNWESDWVQNETNRRMAEELDMLRKRLGPAGVEMLRDLKDRAEKAEAERDRMRSVLETVLRQPFDGSWDAQAVYIQQHLARDALTGSGGE